MVLSGTSTTNVGSHWKLQLEWTATQNVTNNLSTVTAKLYWIADQYGAVYASMVNGGSITINGSKSNFSAHAGLSNGQKRLMHTYAKEVGHSSDGSKTFSISSSFTMKVSLSGSYVESRSTSGSWTLNTIARASGVSLNKTTADIGTPIRITIGSQSSSFRHNVLYAFGGNDTMIWEGIDWTVGDWTLPTSFYNILSSTTTGWGTIHVDTYSNGSRIGRASIRFTANVPDNIVPSFSSLTAVEQTAAVSGIGAYVQGMSKAKLTINGAAGTYGSTITEYTISFNGSSKGNNGVWDIDFSGAKTATASITDSRGRKASRTLSITGIAYSSPAISKFTAARSGNGQGTIVSVFRSGTISSLNGKNQVTVKIDSSLKGKGVWGNESSAVGAVGATTFSSTLNLPNVFNTDLSYDVRVSVVDKFSTSTAIISLSTAFVTMVLGKEGVGFGKIHEGLASIEVAGGAIIDNYIPQKVPAGGNLNSYITPGFYYSNSDADTTTILNTPVNNAFSLQVFSHSGCRQVLRVSTTAAPWTYERNSYDGKWGRWCLTSGTAGNALPMNNGWSFYGGSYQAPQYWLDGNDLGGLIDYGTQKANVQLGSLPVGYRPSSREMFSVFAYGKSGLRVDVTAAGEIIAVDSPTGFISLSGIEFRRNWYY